MSGLTYYFAYGSNLWLHQMSLRCPSSTYVGIALLKKYRWMVNDRGYANIVQTDHSSDVVYGLVYTLTEDDEKRLDVNEGVPIAYTKEVLPIEFWALAPGEKADFGQDSEKKQLLVYIDRIRLEDDKPKAEYIHRVNMGVQDAVQIGVPQSYVDDMIRKFIPAKGDEKDKLMAEKQATSFEDE
ncbi:MAG: hypothetical protein HETSPECPRED_007714 [Heterodermia speciosa]|uniref:gamma-glutamylcyclotransferase n=1 Tax=Heterodermia speciosa TaxID=116794 RepID=A0A8H3FX24_9LECA|nr:MAG: hypothetical protein HETSPECPRED_007714 [Heterodermia speciosa]